MVAACKLEKTGMAAVMPSKRDPATDAAIGSAIQAAGLTVANWNGSHQFVAAGPVDRLEAFAASRPAGLRIASLDVAGAFHTEAMAPATAEFAHAVQRSDFREPTSAMLGNRDGALVADPEDLRHRLVAQITSPVRWDRCSAAIESLATPQAIRVELAPAGPLTRLAERAHPSARPVALCSPDDVDRVRSLAAGSGRP
jgi:[acyl-carrier-protein] S-malonyltransferase